MQVTTLRQFLRAGNTVSKHKRGYKLQNVPAVTVPLDPLTSYIYTQHETSRTCLQPRSSFAWILPLLNIIFPIIDQ